MNAETVLKILETEEREVLYQRPLDASFYLVLSLDCLRLFYLTSDGAAESLALWRKYPNGRLTAARPSTDMILGKGTFASFLSNWSTLYRERRWKDRGPTLGEVARVVNAYMTATGYRLFTLEPGALLATAEPYAPVDVEEMHELIDYDS